MKEIARYGFTLGVICILAGAFLAGVNALTQPKIIAKNLEEEKKALLAVLPQAGRFEPVKLNSQGEIIYYKAYDKDNNSVGVAFKASAKGYSSQIDTMVGLAKDGRVSAVKILSQNETPGLGTKIIEVSDDTTIWDIFSGKNKAQKPIKNPWFQERFRNKKVEDLKDVQAITGATVSSKAVIDSVKKKAEEIKELIKNER